MADPATSEPPVRVLSIVGYGRSGSTILDIVLGNHAQILSAGELINLERSWTNDEYCSCGRRVHACSFWGSVLEALESRISRFDPGEYGQLRRRYERARALPHLLVRSRATAGSPGAYADRMRALFQALREVGGRPVIVDSSKSPERALALSLVPGIDVRVAHLVRDVRGVAWSLKQEYRRDDAAGIQRAVPSRPTWRSALSWSWVNVRASLASGRFRPDHRALLRYEDFATRPQGSLATIGRLLEVDMQDLIEKILAGEAMGVGHVIAGNRVRMQGALQLAPDLAWRRRMTTADRLTTWSIGGILMRRYGYGSGPSDSEPSPH